MDKIESKIKSSTRGFEENLQGNQPHPQAFANLPASLDSLHTWMKGTGTISGGGCSPQWRQLYTIYIQSISKVYPITSIAETSLRRNWEPSTISSANNPIPDIKHTFGPFRESFILGGRLSHPLGARRQASASWLLCEKLGFWMRFFSNAAVVQHLVQNLASSFAGVANSGRFTRKREASDGIFWMPQTPVSREFLRGSQCKTFTPSFRGLHVAFSKTPHFQWIQPSPHLFWGNWVAIHFCCPLHIGWPQVLALCSPLFWIADWELQDLGNHRF